jgi:hypothetical protein
MVWKPKHKIFKVLLNLKKESKIILNIKHFMTKQNQVISTDVPGRQWWASYF